MTNHDSLHQAPVPADPVIPGFGGEGKSGYITGYKDNGKPHVEIMPHEDALARRGVALGAMAIDAEVTPDAAPRQPVTASETWARLEHLSRSGAVKQEGLREANQQSSPVFRYTKHTQTPLAESWARGVDVIQGLEAVVALGAGRALGVVHATRGSGFEQQSARYVSVLSDDPNRRAVLLGELRPDEPFTVGRDTIAAATGMEKLATLRTLVTPPYRLVVRPRAQW